MRNRRGKGGRGRPGPDAANYTHFVFEMKNTLQLEQKFAPVVVDMEAQQQQQQQQLSDGDAIIARDAAARKLRFLKTWFDQSSEAFITCLNLLDRILTRMKVKIHLLDCVSISCFYIASEMHGRVVNAADLVTTSQVKCTASDLERMSALVRNKLAIHTCEPPVTAVTFLEHYMKILDCVAREHGVKTPLLQKKSLLTRLEVVMLDSRCVGIRPSVVALALIQFEMGRLLAPDASNNGAKPHVEMVTRLRLGLCYLQNNCMISASQLLNCNATLNNILQNYDNNARNIQRKRMKMRCSIRRNALKPSENFYTHLCVIRE